MKRLLSGFLILVLVSGCSPPARNFVDAFNKNSQKIEALRTTLCANWKGGGTLMLDRWNAPDLQPADLKRYSNILRSIGAINISLDNKCHAYVAMWQGTVLDLSEWKFVRQQDVGFQFGQMAAAPSDAKATRTSLGHGWELIKSSYTWVS